MREWEGFGETSARNLFNAIDARRTIPLNRFLYALGIRHVGETNARRLARHFGDWESLRAGARAENAAEELSGVGGIGPVVAEAIADFFAEPRNEAALDALVKEVTIEPGLYELENVVVIPHLGSATIETRTAMGVLAARNAIAVLAGEPPLTPIG